MELLTFLPITSCGGVTSVVESVTEGLGRSEAISINLVRYAETEALSRWSLPEREFREGRFDQLAYVRRVFARGVVTPDVLWANGLGLDLAMAASMRRVGTRAVYTAHGNSDYYFRSVASSESFVDRYVALTSAMAAKLVQCVRDPTKVVVIPNGVAVPDSWPVGDRRSARPLKIAYVGRLENQLKGLGRAAPVLRELERLGVAYELSFFGDGDFRAELATQLEDLASAGRVRFEGHVAHDALLRRLPAYHALLLFSHSEGLNMAMLEAMAAGVVPVVPETVGVREVIDDGVNGLVIPQQGLVTGMAFAVSKLFSSEPLWRELSRGAWRTVHQSYSDSLMVAAYRELFLGVASMGPAPKPSGRLACRKDRLDLDWIPNWCARRLRALASRSGRR